MTDSNEHLDQHTAEFLTNFFQQVITGLAAQVEDRLKVLEESVESMEKQIATLILSYGEQAVFTEALVGQMAFATDEARKAFHQSLQDSRKQMFEVMQNASKGFLADENPGVASAVTDLAAEKLSDTDS
jgi:uncharacterized protein (DUF2164 family)